MARNPSAPPAAFANALRSFDTGGLTLSDLKDEVTLLLGDGASPALLLDILERREGIEPLSGGAFAALSGMLGEALAQQAALAGANPANPANPAGMSKPDAGAVRATVLAADLATARATLEAERAKMREMSQTLAEKIASVETARARAEEAMREADRGHAELRELRVAAAAKAATLDETTRALSQRDTQLSALQKEHATVVPALEARVAGSDEREQALKARAQSLEADLASARSALDAEQTRARERDETMSARLGSAEAERLRAEEALREAARLKEENGTLQTALAAREAELAAQAAQSEQAARALEARALKESQLATQLQTELQTAREQAGSHTRELAAVRAELDWERRRVQESQKALADGAATARSQAEAATRTAEQLRHESRQLRESLGARAAELAALKQVQAKAERALEAGGQYTTQLEADLREARARAEAAASDLSVAEAGAVTLDGQLKLANSQLNILRVELDTLKASRTEGDAVRERSRDAARTGTTGEKSESGVLLAQMARVTKEFEAADAFVDRMRSGPGDAARPKEMQTARLAAPPSREAAAPVRQPLRPAVGPDTPMGQDAGTSSLVVELLASGKAAARSSTPVPAGATVGGGSAGGAMVPGLAARGAQPGGSGMPRGGTSGAGAPGAMSPGAAGSGGAPPDSLRAVAERVKALKPPSMRSAVGVIATVLLAAVALWAMIHHKTAPVTPLVPASALAIPAPGAVIQDCADCPAMKVLPTGRFKQGSARTDGIATAFERPQHWVNLTRPIAMSTNTVTVDEFRRFAVATGAALGGCETYDGEWRLHADLDWQNPGFTQSGTHPVTCVSFDDATAYAKWLSITTGHLYRLPSASEWEYAALAGSEAGQPWRRSDSGACADANVADMSAAREYPGWHVFPCDDGYVNTAPVGSFDANAFGLNDMLGNVFQWTQDCWAPDYTNAPVDGSARHDGECGKRELRGGSWFSSPAYVRATFRNHLDTTLRTSTVGIRLVRELP